MEDSESKYELLSNRINNSLFKFLMREYYSRTINPYYCLKLLSKIYHTKLTDKMKEKCSSFLFIVLQGLNISNAMQENITPIINDMLDNVLTKKADYPIILHYAYFLINTGKVQKAITTIQIFSNENRFMNSGEILFNKSLIEYVIERKTEAIHFIKEIEKAILLIKRYRSSYYIWILDFSIENKMKNEIKETVIKNIHLQTEINTCKLNYVKLLLNEDDSINRLKRLSAYLVSNQFHYSLLERIKELAVSFYQENFSSYSDDSSIVSILKSIDENLLYNYIAFLFAYSVYQPFEEKCYEELIDVLNEINTLVNSKETANKCELFSSEQLFESFKQAIISFYKTIVFVVLKTKIRKEVIHHMKSKKKNEGLIGTIENWLIMINITKEIITGSPLIVITKEVKDNLMTKAFVQYILALKI